MASERSGDVQIWYARSARPQAGIGDSG